MSKPLKGLHFTGTMTDMEWETVDFGGPYFDEDEALAAIRNAPPQFGEKSFILKVVRVFKNSHQAIEVELED